MSKNVKFCVWWHEKAAESNIWQFETNDIKGSTTEIKVQATFEVKTYEKSDRLDDYFSRGQSNVYRDSRGLGYNRFKENNQG